jgi:hypothetical protein
MLWWTMDLAFMLVAQMPQLVTMILRQQMMMGLAPIHPKPVWIVKVLVFKTVMLTAHAIAWR